MTQNVPAVLFIGSPADRPRYETAFAESYTVTGDASLDDLATASTAHEYVVVDGMRFSRAAVEAALRSTPNAVHTLLADAPAESSSFHLVGRSKLEVLAEGPAAIADRLAARRDYHEAVARLFSQVTNSPQVSRQSQAVRDLRHDADQLITDLDSLDHQVEFARHEASTEAWSRGSSHL